MYFLRFSGIFSLLKKTAHPQCTERQWVLSLGYRIFTPPEATNTGPGLDQGSGGGARGVAATDVAVGVGEWGCFFFFA